MRSFLFNMNVFSYTRKIQRLTTAFSVSHLYIVQSSPILKRMTTDYSTNLVDTHFPTLVWIIRHLVQLFDITYLAADKEKYM